MGEDSPIPPNMLRKREHADWAMDWQVEEVDTSSMSKLFVSKSQRCANANG